MKSDRKAVNPAVSARFRAMQHRNFQLFIAGQLISLIGTWMQTTAQLQLVWELTGSAALLGVFGFASQVPMLFLSSLGGYLGDHYNRHRAVIATQTVSMILAFVLAVLTLTNVVREWEVILIALSGGACDCGVCDGVGWRRLVFLFEWAELSGGDRGLADDANRPHGNKAE